jgi:hypothetical protein
LAHDELRLLAHDELRLLAHDETGLRSHDARAHALIEATAATLPQYQEEDAGETRYARDEDTRNHAWIRVAAVVLCPGETGSSAPVFFGPFLKSTATSVKGVTFWINQMIATQTGCRANAVVGHPVFAFGAPCAKVIVHDTAAGRTKITPVALVVLVAIRLHVVRFAHVYRIRVCIIPACVARIRANIIRIAVCSPVAVTVIVR